MPINLEKGGEIDLTKDDSGLRSVMVGLGWDTNRYDGGYAFDLDASVFMLGENGKLLRDKDFIFYNNLCSRNAAVIHTGDNLTGGGEGDAEVILIDFSKIPADIKKLAVCVSIYKADVRRQNFGQVSNAYIRLVRMADNFEREDETVLRYDLVEEFSIETALVVAEIYNRNGVWRFNAVASGYKGGLAAIVRDFGGNV